MHVRFTIRQLLHFKPVPVCYCIATKAWTKFIGQCCQMQYRHSSGERYCRDILST